MKLEKFTRSEKVAKGLKEIKQLQDIYDSVTARMKETASEYNTIYTDEEKEVYKEKLKKLKEKIKKIRDEIGMPETQKELFGINKNKRFKI